MLIRQVKFIVFLAVTVSGLSKASAKQLKCITRGCSGCGINSETLIDTKKGAVMYTSAYEGDGLSDPPQGSVSKILSGDSVCDVAVDVKQACVAEELDSERGLELEVNCNKNLKLKVVVTKFGFGSLWCVRPDSSSFSLDLGTCF